eukprot:GHUV01016024.1.p1 GENE.GHUV01016024.1~~GHUV01016024.1.p1  ORF type:complete len:302 (+),score=64.81 GHUV01016024.1:294-1199(+)
MWFLSTLLLLVVLERARAQLASCSVLDNHGCCGPSCQMAICQSLYSSGQQLGAAEPGVWINRAGWDALYNHPGPANAACQQQLSASAALAASQPAYCTWDGIVCNATYSTCSQSGWAYGVTNITITNNNLSGDIGDAFVTELKQLHDCGLLRLVIGGASFALYGTISKLFGQFNQLKTLSIFGTNVSGTIPADLGNMTALEVLDLNTNYLTGVVPSGKDHGCHKLQHTCKQQQQQRQPPCSSSHLTSSTLACICMNSGMHLWDFILSAWLDPMGIISTLSTQRPRLISTVRTEAVVGQLAV